MKIALCSTVILACVALAVASKSSEMYGHVYWSNNTPAEGVVLSIGNYSVTTEKDGSYKMTFLRPGRLVVSITPPGKSTQKRTVTINPEPTLQDFKIDW